MVAVPEAHVTKPVLDGALEAVTRLNEQLIKSGASPTSHQLIERGAEWRPEKPGDEHFDHGALIARRGFGDCDDWAPLHAATLRASGKDPGATAIVRKSGEKRWHAIVRRSDGTIEDPSLAAGMPGPGASNIHGAWVPVMRGTSHAVSGGSYIATPQLALRPEIDRWGEVESWQARTDLPWHWAPGNTPADLAMVTLHRSPVSSQALVGAVRGAFDLGLASGDVHPENLKRLSAIAEACEGASWEDIAQAYGPEHANAAGALVEGFFGKALRKLGKIAKGAGKLAMKGVRAASPIASLIPGGSLATSAFNMADKALKGCVKKQKHVPPEHRAPLLVSTAPAPPQRPAASPFGGGGWLPYPYPLPYPVPGWGGASGSAASSPQPGAAWPPRGRR